MVKTSKKWAKTHKPVHKSKGYNSCPIQENKKNHMVNLQ
jgi:hypothetical protein